MTETYTEKEVLENTRDFWKWLEKNPKSQKHEWECSLMNV